MCECGLPKECDSDEYCRSCLIEKRVEAYKDYLERTGELEQ